MATLCTKTNNKTRPTFDWSCFVIESKIVYSADSSTTSVVSSVTTSGSTIAFAAYSASSLAASAFVK
jgi:hypothetical protein